MDDLRGLDIEEIKRVFPGLEEFVRWIVKKELKKNGIIS